MGKLGQQNRPVITPKSKKRGLTLMEVMISLVLFSLLAAGVFSATLQARRHAEANVREAIAVSVATGFLEQLAATDFPLLARHVDNRAINFPFIARDGRPVVPSKNLRPLNATGWGDPIEVPIRAEKDASGNVVLDSDGNPQEALMDFWFIPMASRSTDTPGDAIEIAIHFRWDNGRSQATGFYPERRLVTLRTRVPH
jgi:prepilin-type N-terminal cleavage/methylation domain-containing protein